MKKFLITILALVYLATSTGATIHMHYCMGKIYSVDIVQKDKCSKCGMEASEGCCHDQLKVIKIKDNHQATNNGINFFPAYSVVYTYYNNSNEVVTNIAATSTTNNNSPPPISGKSRCILNSVFRI